MWRKRIICYTLATPAATQYDILDSYWGSEIEVKTRGQPNRRKIATKWSPRASGAGPEPKPGFASRAPAGQAGDASRARPEDQVSQEAGWLPGSLVGAGAFE